MVVRRTDLLVAASSSALLLPLLHHRGGIRIVFVEVSTGQREYCCFSWWRRKMRHFIRWPNSDYIYYSNITAVRVIFWYKLNWWGEGRDKIVWKRVTAMCSAIDTAKGPFITENSSLLKWCRRLVHIIPCSFIPSSSSAFNPLPKYPNLLSRCSNYRV